MAGIGEISIWNLDNVKSKDFHHNILTPHFVPVRVVKVIKESRMIYV